MMETDFWNDMISVRDEMDPIFEAALERVLSDWPTRIEVETNVPMDVFEDQDQFLIRLDVPGLDRKTLSLNLEGQLLKISGNFQRPDCEEQEVVLRERCKGRFERVLALPYGFHQSCQDISYKGGILTITLAKA